MKSEVQVPMVGGIVSSSKTTAYHLIPTVGLEGLAKRFEAGVERKGKAAWNAVSSNQACLLNKEFVVERISHIINHAMLLRDKIVADDFAAMDDDDDAGAIAWAGVFLLCAIDAMKKVNKSGN